MKKLIPWFAVFTALAFLFTGCPQEPKDDKPPVEDPIPVSSIGILVDGYTPILVSGFYEMFENTTAALSAQVLPSAATEKGYAFTVTEGNNTVVSLTGGTLTALSEGNATIKVTSTGKKADETYATDELKIKVSKDPSLIEVELLITNQNTTTDPKTTTTLPALNADKRYVIVNNEADANIPNAWADMKGNTIAYISKPLQIQSEVVGEAITYIPYSISARVRITEGRDSPALDETGNGVLVGIFTDPRVQPSATTPLLFVTLRSSWSGQKRMYASRAGTNNNNSSTAIQTGTDYDLADSVNTKTTGFRDQEFIYKVERINSSTYNLSILSADGVTLLVTNTRGAGANQVHETIFQSVENYLYLGFIISGVTVEISDIVVKDGTDEIFKSTPGNPYPVNIRKVNIATNNPVGADANYDYQCTQAAFPVGGVQLNAQAIPLEANQTVTWSITEGSGIASVNNGLVTVTGSGEVTVKAQSAGEAAGLFKFNILAGTPDAVKVNVTGPATITAGGTITFSATVDPALANQAVSWSVTASDGSSATTAANIDASGVLTAAAVTSETVVNVFATAHNSVKSSAHLLTIKVAGTGPTPPQIWRTAIGNQSIAGEDHTVVVNSTTLTMKGTGSINSSGQIFNFVYLKASGDFTMIVKLDTVSWGSANNAARLGLMAIPQSSGSQNSGTGELTGVPTGTTLEYAGSVLRGDNSWVRQQNVNGTAGTSNINSTNFPTGTALPAGGAYLRLRRVGANFYAGASMDGTTWYDAGATAPESVTNAYLGLAVSGNSTNIATVTFSNLYFKAGEGMGAATVTSAELDLIDFNWLASDPGTDPGGDFTPTKTTTFTFGAETLGTGNAQVDNSNNWQSTGDWCPPYVKDGISMSFPAVTQFRWAPQQTQAPYAGRIAANGGAARDPLATIANLQGPFKITAVMAATNATTTAIELQIKVNSAVAASDATGAVSTTTPVTLEYTYTGNDTATVIFASPNANFVIWEVKIEQ